MDSLSTRLRGISLLDDFVDTPLAALYQQDFDLSDGEGENVVKKIDER